MKISEFIRGIAVPAVTAITGVMIFVLNAKVATVDDEIKRRDQDLKEKIGEIDLFLANSKEEREERESSQNFNLRIYEIVTASLEEKNPEKQEAAKAFIVVMVDEPLRTSLLNVLKQGGDSKVKQKIGQILQEEEKFKSNVATIPEKRTEIAATYNWGEWDFDIFWCATSGATAQTFAEKIGERLIAEGAEGRVRIRELPESINARPGYQIQGFAIRRNAKEEEAARALKNLAEQAVAETGSKATFSLGLTRQSTPWYISAFVCPSG